VTDIRNHARPPRRWRRCHSDVGHRALLAVFNSWSADCYTPLNDRARQLKQTNGAGVWRWRRRMDARP